MQLGHLNKRLVNVQSLVPFTGVWEKNVTQGQLSRCSHLPRHTGREEKWTPNPEGQNPAERPGEKQGPQEKEVRYPRQARERGW